MVEWLVRMISIYGTYERCIPYVEEIRVLIFSIVAQPPPRTAFLNALLAHQRLTLWHVNSRRHESCMVMSSEHQERHGSCHCGKVSVTVRGRPIVVSICHCTTCQRLLGAPFGVQSMHSPENFECNVGVEELWSLETSKTVTRYRCRDCGSPVFASLRNGHSFVVPRSMLFQPSTSHKDNDEHDNDVAYKPIHHMYYQSRIIDVQDDLPKYVGTSRPGKGILWMPPDDDNKSQHGTNRS